MKDLITLLADDLIMGCACQFCAGIVCCDHFMARVENNSRMVYRMEDGFPFLLRRIRISLCPY
jgi:hypothetical protein